MTELAFVLGCGAGAVGMIVAVLLYHTFYLRVIDRSADTTIGEDRPQDDSIPAWNKPGKRR